MWPDRRILDLVGLEHPIVQAPMIGPKSDLTAAVSGAGGLGSLGSAASTPDQVRAEVEIIRQRTSSPLNLNFFCHTPAAPDPARESAWRARLAGHYRELGVDPDASVRAVNRLPFDEAMCETVVALRPKVVSFHFGLPKRALLDAVKAAGCVVFSSATTAAEARWLEEHGADVVIAQGAEAGGHRGKFLGEDNEIATQVGTLALVPQVVDAVRVPVIAAGGIADGRGIAAAMALGASAVQIGTAYLFCPEAGIPRLHLEALRKTADDGTAITNVFTGRPARAIFNRAVRELGPISPDAPVFPSAAPAIQPLRAAAESRGSAEFSPYWSGQAAHLGRELGAAELTRRLAEEALARLRAITPRG